MATKAAKAWWVRHKDEREEHREERQGGTPQVVDKKKTVQEAATTREGSERDPSDPDVQHILGISSEQKKLDQALAATAKKLGWPKVGVDDLDPGRRK